MNGELTLDFESERYLSPTDERSSPDALFFCCTATGGGPCSCNQNPDPLAASYISVASECRSDCSPC